MISFSVLFVSSHLFVSVDNIVLVRILLLIFNTGNDSAIYGTFKEAEMDEETIVAVVSDFPMKRPREEDENRDVAFETSGYISSVNSGWFSESSLILLICSILLSMEISVTSGSLVQLLLKSSQDERFVCEAAEKALLALRTWDAEEMKAYGIEKLIEIRAFQVSDQLPESQEVSHALMLDLLTAYEKSLVLASESHTGSIKLKQGVNRED
ncbi:hypothetical protein L6452_14973 [Arctium lappa]|uniref:Uncharacterized protein n=1 Tax=Arctium lappa TaxID=4217 RepID=A0ACB9CMG8_ARCLA|nr:hypothetical protein L6452_14973 [Arctium lappa]